jgi:flagellar hook-length control protein FliK
MILTAANPNPAPPTGAASSPGTTVSPGIAPPPASAVGVDAKTVPGSGLNMPQAASIWSPAAPGTSTAATVPAVPTGNAASAKLGGATVNPGTASANSAPSSTNGNAQNDSTLSNDPAAAGTDAAAQAVMTAGIAQGTSAPAPDNSSSDASAIPDAGAPPVAAGTSDPAAAAPAAVVSAVALVRASAASMAAATTAATAAAVVQALSDAASAGAADKRSHAGGDATLSGASNDGSVGAAQLLTSNTSSDSVQMPTFKVAAGVDTAQFGQGVADRVGLMMDGNLTSAKLQVNPPALGPIEVRIALQGGHAQVWLSSHSALTRDALESSSSKLREMLGSQGFSHVSVDISQRSFQERSPPSQAYESAPAISSDVPVLAQASLSMSRSASGLLDAYA